MEDARQRVATLLECSSDEIVFTSGGTEANNLAIRGATEARSDYRHIVTSVIEHPATPSPCQWLGRHGYRVSWIGVDAEGRVQVQALLASQARIYPWVFTNSRTGKPYTPNGVLHVCKRAAVRAGIPRADVTLHTLRHTALSRIIAGGHDD